MRNLQIDNLFSELTRNPAFQALAARVAPDRAAPGVLRLSGLTLTAKALYAVLLHHATGRPQLIIVDGNKQAEALFPMLQTFAGLVDASDGTPGSMPLLLPALDVLPGQSMSPHAEILATRATALSQLADGGGGIVLMPVAAALTRTEVPQYYRQLTQTLRIHDEIPLDDLAAHLESVGYERRDPVEMAGEFSIRGGILDVFSPEEVQPVRVEFFGDEIESIRRFDPESQRSIHKLNECVLQPLTEFQKSRGLLADLANRLVEAGARSRDLPPPGEPFAGWELLVSAVRPRPASILDFFEKPLLVVDEPELTKAAADRLWTRMAESGSMAAIDPASAMLDWERFSELAAARGTLEVRHLDVGDASAQTGDDVYHISSRPSMAFHGNLQVAIREAKTLLESDCRLAFFAPTAGEVERLADVFAEYSVPYHVDLRGEQVPEYLQQRTQSLNAGIALIRGDVARGTVFQQGRLAIFGAEDLFESPDTVAKPGKSHLGTFSADQFDLKAGDYVVHLEHGVGQFLGIREIAQGETKGDYMLIEYAGGNKLYVPLSRMDLVQRFRGEGESKPVLDKMGGATWTRTKTRIKARMRDMAEELLKLYAARRLAPGFAFSPDSNWQREFEDAFEFTETRDQKTAIADIKRDMESPQPMDRLLCGDVGYGKTEVVMRAAFKAMGDGKQVAVLAPTTVLCFQHFETFKKRFQPFPVRIEMLSRFRTAKAIKDVLHDLGEGKVDLVVGTHRVFSKDVAWKDLGLVIIDEEQRFGVKHKERLKEICKNIDAIAMSATPIPRTLHMSLLGLRDLSVIETPPKDRLAIQTVVAPFAPDVIKSAIELELARGGQVYFVHNRIDSIWHRAAMIQEMFPDARIGVGHGQMAEAELEKVMLQFMRHEFQVFVSTTIVENGLDIPLANTIIIETAERYGLSELYQLRGRVGRSNRRAYCYLFVEPDSELTEVARKRLAALKEFSDLGAGFKIAALDLELRGAGNLLGGEQHGHINAIGFDMYVRMLEDTVRELRGEEVAAEIHSSLNLGLDLRIPASYIADENQRLRAYKRIAQAVDDTERERVEQELADRYGPVPDDVRQLLAYSAIKTAAEKIGIEAIDRRHSVLNVKFHEETRVDGEKLMSLVSGTPGAQFTPAGVLRLPVDGTGTPAAILELIEQKLIAPLS
ncbi:MAG TPA: transcription-repair coupling factor [Bryobacteraceae bacterium]|nr:transcription-repair coupling factor [Bryobacteraceae bacterium]